MTKNLLLDELLPMQEQPQFLRKHYIGLPLGYILMETFESLGKNAYATVVLWAFPITKKYWYYLRHLSEDKTITQVALVFILSNNESKDLESIKSSLYSLYTNGKLQECAPNLPKGFFPNYTYVREYCQIFRDQKSWKNTSMIEKMCIC